MTTSALQHPLIKRLASVKITVVCLFLLFILVFWGTIAQVQAGLYIAQARFFNSFFFLAGGWIPFPGAQSVLWVLFINLSCVTATRFIHYRKPQHAGILITHFGLLLYLLSAFVTLHVSREHNLHLMEGQGSNLVTSYTEWEISIWKDKGDTRHVWAHDTASFQPGYSFTVPEMKSTITVKKFFPNAIPLQAPFMPSTYHNASGIKVLEAAAIDKEREKNIVGGYFDITPQGEPAIPVILYGGEMEPTPVTVHGQDYFVMLRHKKTELPFMVTLQEFRAQFYPGTEVAKSYESTVEIHTADMKRDVIISMNKPFRFKDWTFYQASYEVDSAGRKYSTLAVVKNAGRLLPYIACFVVFAGLAIHFLIMAFQSKWKPQ